MLKVSDFVLLTAIGLTAPAVAAADIEGIVQVSGSAMNVEVRLVPKGESKGSEVCRGDQAKRIRKLSSMTVSASGSWKMDAKNEPKCFEVSDFKVLKTSTGRDAVVGVFSAADGKYAVTEDGGKVHALADVPAGLRKMEGKKVILDIRPMENPTSKESSFKVVTYAAWP